MRPLRVFGSTVLSSCSIQVLLILSLFGIAAENVTTVRTDITTEKPCVDNPVPCNFPANEARPYDNKTFIERKATANSSVSDRSMVSSTEASTMTSSTLDYNDSTAESVTDATLISSTTEGTSLASSTIPTFPSTNEYATTLPVTTITNSVTTTLATPTTTQQTDTGENVTASASAEDSGSMPTGIVALITLITFAVIAVLAYVSLIVWRRYLEYRHGNRELLVNELEFDTNDLRHFEL